jgi:hypothetical protein
MYDKWVDAADKGEFSGVTLLDMSAAFDIVDHPLLLEKLDLYGMNENSLRWMESYLSGWLSIFFSSCGVWGSPSVYSRTTTICAVYK